jgi:hypothetical protein
LEYRTDQRHLLDKLMAANPRAADFKMELLGNLLGIARIEITKGDLRSAERDLANAIDRARAMLAEQPDNQTLYYQLRMTELFQARTWLSMPPAQRPATEQIRKTIGSCTPALGHDSVMEMVAFCTIQQTRLLAAEGNHDDAKKLIATLHLDRPGRHALTPQWSLDLNEEAAAPVAF